MPAAVLHLPSSTARPRGATPDAELARAAGRGDVAAFEALYERHHLGLLSFCRHMLGRPHDAEDVVQHTFLAADRTFRSGRVPKAVRAWLYTVARNRCVSLLRARRDDRALPDAAMPATESLAAEVERREELRHLLADLRALPDDQRAALLLSELGDLSHAEVADVLGVRTAKVKALVFQARKTLLAVSDARAIPCPSIRDELAGAYGSAQRRRHLRDHLERCEGCRAFHAAVRRQRSAVAAILPVAPSVALRDGILAGLGVGTAGATAAGGAGFGALAAKLLAVAAIGGAAAGGTTVSMRATGDEPRAQPPRQAPAAVVEPVALPGGGPQSGGAPAERPARSTPERAPAPKATSPVRPARERARPGPAPSTAEAGPGHAEAVKPVTAQQPAHPVELKPVKPAKPVKAAKPAKPVMPEPLKAAKPAKPVKPAKPAKPVKPAKPAEPVSAAAPVPAAPAGEAVPGRGPKPKR